MPANKEKMVGGGILTALLIGLLVRMAFVTADNAEHQEQRDQELRQRIKAEFNGLQSQFDAMNRHPTTTTYPDAATQPPASQP